MFRDVILLPVQTFSKVCSAQKHLVWINSEHIKEKGAFFFFMSEGSREEKNATAGNRQVGTRLAGDGPGDVPRNAQDACSMTMDFPQEERWEFSQLHF